jgi:hypothetical protein
MSWPANPLNGQQVTVNGLLYSWNDNNKTWDRIGYVSAAVTTDETVLTKLTVTARSTLGDIANVHISGGAAGQVIQTDGAGNLSWKTEAVLTPGGSNTFVQFNDENTYLGGVANFAFDKTSNTLSVDYANLVLTAGANNQPNITTVGSLSNLEVTGNLTVYGNTDLVGNLHIGGTVISSGGITASKYTAPAANNQILLNKSGNIDGSANLTFTNSNTLAVIGNITATKDVVAANLTGTLTVSASNQPNISNVGTLGNLAVTSNITAGNIKVAFANANIYNAPNSTANTQILVNKAGNIGSYSNLYFDGNLLTVTGNILARNANLGNAVIANYFTGNLTTGPQTGITNVGTLDTLTVSGNITSGNATLGNLATANYITGVLTSSSQPNITTIGSLSNLRVSGNANIDGNLYIGGTTIGAGGITAPTFTGKVIGDVSGTLTAPGSDKQVLFNKAGNVSASANITFTEGGGPSRPANLTVIGNIKSNNISVVSTLTAPNISGIFTAGAGYQPNIISVGTLNSLTVDGGDSTFRNSVIDTTTNVQIRGPLVPTGFEEYDIGSPTHHWRDLYLAGHTIRLGNTVITATTQNGLVVSGPVTATGGVSSDTSTSSFNLPSITATSTGGVSTITFAPQTVVPFVKGSYVTITNIVPIGYNGTYTVTDATLSSISYLKTVVGSQTVVGKISAGASPPFTVTSTLEVANLNVQFLQGFEPAITDIANTIVLRDEYSSFQANVITANSIIGLNPLVATVDIANTVLSSSQPNITSTGTLVSLDVTGLITAANIDIGDYVDATYVRANIRDSIGYLGQNIIGAVTYASTANSVTGANVFGQVSNSLVAGTVYNHAQPNITSVGVLSDIHVSGNADIDGNLHIGGTVISAGGITAPSFNGALSGTITSPGANSEILFNKQGILGTDPDFKYNNLTKELKISGKFSSVDADLGNAAVANYFIGNAYYLTHLQAANIDGTVATATKAGTVTTNAQPNITSIGTLISLHVSGDSLLDGNLYVGGTTISAGGLSSPSLAIDKGVITTDQPISINEEWNNSLVSFTSFQQEIIDTASDPTSLLAEFNVNGLNVFKIDKTGNVTSKDITARNIAGTLTASRQTNITAIGKLGSLDVSGEVKFDGNLLADKDITTRGYFKGDGSLLTGLPRPTEIKNNDNSSNVKIYPDGNVTISVANDSNVVIFSDANVYIKDTIISANANLGDKVRANFFIGNGNSLANLTGANVLGYVPLATAATTAGTVTASSQPTITNIGTLVSLATINTVNATLGNSVTSNYFLGKFGVGASNQPNISNIGTLIGLTTSATVDASLGNSVTTNYIKSDGTYLFNIPGANVTGTVASATIATTAGTVTNPTQSTITKLGTLTSLDVSGVTTTKDITITGNLTVSGDTITANVTGLVVQDPLIEMGGNLNGVLTTNDGYDRGTVMHYYDTGTASQTDAFMGWKNSAKEFVFASKATIATNIATIVSLGNIKVGNANIVSNLKVDGNLIGTLDATSNNQPNITSIGKLANLVVGNTTNFATHGNGTITTNGDITVTTGYYFRGDGSKLTGIDATSIKSGTSNVIVYSSDNVAVSVNGTVNSVVMTSTGIFTANANLSANLYAGNAFVTGTVRVPTLFANIADGTAPLSVLSKTRVANLNVDYANVSDYTVVKNTTTGTYYPVLSSGVTDGNYQFAGNSTLAYNVATGNLSATLLTGTLTTAGQPNITSIGRLTTLTVGGLSANTVIDSSGVNANGIVTSIDLKVENSAFAAGSGNVNFIKTANVSLGAIANLHILGGAPGDFVQTDGAGVLTFAKPKGKITTTVNNFLAGSGFDIVTDYTDAAFPSGKFVINQVGPVAISVTDTWSISGSSVGTSKNAYIDFTTTTVNTANVSISLSLVNATFAITASDTIVIGGIAITGTNITSLGISGTGGTYIITSTLLNSISGGSAIQTAVSNTVSINLTTTRGSYIATGTTLTNVQQTAFNVSLSGGFPNSSVPFWATLQTFNWNMTPVTGTVVSGNVTYTPTAGGASTSLTSTGATSGTSASINSLVSYTITTTDYRGTGLNGGGTKTLPTLTATVLAATSYTPLFYKITTTSTPPTLTTSDSYLPQAYALGQGATTPSVTTSYLWIATPSTTPHTWAYTFVGSPVGQSPTVAGTTITISGQAYTLYGFAGFGQAYALYTVT